MYRINIYAFEKWQRSVVAFNEPDAIAKAYAYIGTNGVRVAHIIKVGTDHGIYIARCGDPDLASFAERVAILERVKWEL